MCLIKDSQALQILLRPLINEELKESQSLSLVEDLEGIAKGLDFLNKLLGLYLKTACIQYGRS